MLSIQGHAQLSHLEERLKMVLGPELHPFALELLTEVATVGMITPESADIISSGYSIEGRPTREVLREILGILEHDEYIQQPPWRLQTRVQTSERLVEGPFCIWVYTRFREEGIIPMSQLPLKYNPGFADDEDLIRLFVVRQQCLDFILRTIDENNGPSNQHVLVVGPRGSGKTTLVRRVASELRTNSKYNGWFPVIFAEESYEVSTPGEFWLEALLRLANQPSRSVGAKPITKSNSKLMTC